MSDSNGVKELADRLGISFADSGSDTVDTISLSCGTPDLSISTGTFGNYNWSTTMASGITSGISQSPYIVSNSASAGWSTIEPSAKIVLNGKDADIIVNEVSLMDMLANIESRLNILHPNTKLEADWDELRELGDQYRALEKQIKEKADMWEKLKAMPPPKID